MVGLKENLDHASLFLKEKKYSEARLILEAVLDNLPSNKRAKQLLARCMMLERRWEEASDLWVDIFKVDKSEFVIVNLMKSALKAQQIYRFKFFAEQISEDSESLRIFKHAYQLMFSEHVQYPDCLSSKDSQELFARLIAVEVSKESFPFYSILLQKLLDQYLTSVESIKFQSWIFNLIHRLGELSFLNKFYRLIQFTSLSSRELHQLTDFLVHSKGANHANAFVATVDDKPLKEMLFEKVVRIDAWRGLKLSIGDTFFDSMRNVAICIASKNFDQAGALLRRVREAFPDHYYPKLIQIQFDKIVRPYDLNEKLLDDVTSTHPGSLSVQLEALDSFSRVHRHKSVKSIVDSLLSQYPLNPFVLGVARRHGVLVSVGLSEKVDFNLSFQKDRITSFLHSGDLGDIIYCLPAIRVFGKGVLYLTCKHDTRNQISNSSIDFLFELLLSSGYIVDVKLWHGEPIDYDFTEVRRSQSPTKNIALAHWEHICPNADLKFDINSSWLSLPANVERQNSPPLFSRSARYRSEEIWGAVWKSLKASYSDANFMGTEEEFSQFRHGNLLRTPTALSMAEAIWSARFFVGNQSFPYALAEALKVPRMLERSPICPNCDFDGSISL